MKKFYLLSAFVFLYGCASAMDATITLNHTPATKVKVDGLIKVTNITRTPKQGIAPTQFNTAGYIFDKQISLTEPLVNNFKTAIVQEMRRAGVSSRGEKTCTLSANINEIGITYTGNDKVDLVGNVSFQLNSPSGQIIFENVADTTLPTETLWIKEAYSDFLTTLIDQAISKEDFAAAVEKNCKI